MNGLKQIMYGVTDFALMRAKNGYFVDRTDLIRELEKTRYTGLKGSDVRLYVFIDEYDNFTNTILAEHGTEAYNALCHGEGFFKQFFTELKLAATGTRSSRTGTSIGAARPCTCSDAETGKMKTQS